MESKKQKGEQRKRKKRHNYMSQIGEPLNPNDLRYIDNQGMIHDEASSGFWSSEIKAFLEAQTLKALFYHEDWVYITVDSIALPISFCPIKVYSKVKMENAKNKFIELDNHPISKLFENPNQYQSSTEIAYQFAVDFVLGGNSFLYHPKGLNQIFHMPFERCQYNFDGEGIPESISFYPQQQDDVLVLRDMKKNIPLDEAIHSRKPNPSSAFWGLSPFTAGRKCVLANRYTQDYILSFYLKGATPQMILELDTAASQKALVRMIRSFEAAYTGRRNQRRTMVLPKGVKATVADTKIVDQQFIDLVKQNRETILNVLRVPKHALGLQESGSLGSREHELALRWYWDQTIMPIMRMMAEAITSHFRKRKMINDDQYIDFDTSEVKYVADDLLIQAETSNSLERTWTVNERRERIFGLPKIEGGDVVAGIANKNQGIFSDIPFEFSSEKQNEQQQQTEENNAQVKTIISKRKKYRIPEKYESLLRTNETAVEKEIEQTEPSMKKVAFKLLVDQTEKAVTVFKDMYEKSLRADEKPTIKNYKKNLNKAIDELEEEYLDSYYNTMESTVSVGYGAQANMIFDNKSKEAILAYKDKDVKGQRKNLIERGVFQFKSSRDSTTDRIAGIIEKSLEQGKTVDEISRKIVTYMKENAQWRANMIARTETLTAFSIGGMATLDRAKEAIPNLKKMWVTSNDEDVRDEHEALMGVVVDADEEFEFPSGERTMFPRAMGMSAGNAINCRCAVLMLPPEDVADYTQEIKDLD